MIPDNIARKLHDRSSRGEKLSIDEQQQLNNWYTAQDTAEGKMLGLISGEKSIASLQAQINAALTQLMTVTKRIHEVASENETLRHEIAVLRRKLMQRLGAQPA